MLWIAALDQPISRSRPKEGYTSIPSKLINQVSGEFTNAYQLSEQLKTAKSDIAELKSFRLQALALIAVLLLVLSPFIKTSLESLLQSGSTQPSPPVVSTPPTNAPSVPPTP
jgi:dCTP deaminase